MCENTFAQVSRTAEVLAASALVLFVCGLLECLFLLCFVLCCLFVSVSSFCIRVCLLVSSFCCFLIVCLFVYVFALIVCFIRRFPSVCLLVCVFGCLLIVC